MVEIMMSLIVSDVTGGAGSCAGVAVWTLRGDIATVAKNKADRYLRIAISLSIARS
jgi:hypothetical protein